MYSNIHYSLFSFFMYLHWHWIQSNCLPLKVKSSSSQALGGICSVTFDVVEGSFERHVTPHPAESSSCSVSPEAVREPADHQRATKAESDRQRNLKPALSGEEDVCLDQEQPSPENAAADKTHDEVDDEADHVNDDETQTVADPVEGTNIPCASDLDVLEEKEESTLLFQPQITKETEAKSDDLFERPGSVMSSSKPRAAATGHEASETMTKESAAEQEDRDTDNDDDVRVRAEKTQVDNKQVELKDEGSWDYKGGNREKIIQNSRAQQKPDVESSSTQSQTTGVH